MALSSLLARAASKRRVLYLAGQVRGYGSQGGPTPVLARENGRIKRAKSPLAASARRFAPYFQGHDDERAPVLHRTGRGCPPKKLARCLASKNPVPTHATTGGPA
jgi:hypothetical protein